MQLPTGKKGLIALSTEMAGIHQEIKPLIDQGRETHAPLDFHRRF